MQGSREALIIDALQAENAELRLRLEEAEGTLRAIREGEVDAVIVSGSQGDRVFSLTETENLHRQMVETMSEAGLAISPDGLLLYCNERVATLLGRPRGMLLGRRLDEFVAPQDADRLRDLLVASAQGTADDRVVFRAADEAGVPLHLWASRLHRPEGPLICLVGTDLSRLEAERALVAQLQEQQRALSASRAEALDVMRQAVAAREDTARVARELREADRRKDAFLAMLAHELRNPLAPISNVLAILRLTLPADSQALSDLGVMERHFTHLVRLLDDLLEVSRFTRGKIDLRKEPVQLASVIVAAVESVSALIEAAWQRLIVTQPPEPIWLEADPVRLVQVFGNLLNNASKFTPKGGEIRLTVEPRGGEVEVCVCDTGVGIPETLLPHVFELFRQGGAEQSCGQGGMGIGLFLVKRLTQLHRGSVEVASAGLDRGSTLRVTLPLITEPPEPTTTRTGSGGQGPCRASPGARVLVVDDNQDAADSLGSLLSRQGALVEVAYDGPSALERLAVARIDLVILDIGMPGMDGHEVARRIRARHHARPPILIAMSGLGQAADRQRSLDSGFDDHLVKPVSLDVLDSLLSARCGLDPVAYMPEEVAPGVLRLSDDRSPGPLPLAPSFKCDGTGRLAVDPGLPRPARDGGARARGASDDSAGATLSLEGLRPVARAFIHDLAQPLNTAACYAVAARNLAAKSTAHSGPLCSALSGIDEQIRLAGTAMERLRGLFRGGVEGGEDSKHKA